MSMPNIPNINPEINIVRDDAVNIIMASIAMEELALAHILNAEGEKLQYVLGTLEGRDPGEVTICDIMAVNNSIHKTLRDVIKQEMLLQIKLEDVIELAENASECQLTIRGQKTWRDGNNMYNTRPATVEINLLRDGEIYQTTTVDSMGDGTYIFACLPLWRDSENRYSYQIEEVAPEGYTRTISGYNVTNIALPGSMTIDGSKIWIDNDNELQVRPVSITVNLLQNGVQYRQDTVASPEDTEDTALFSFTNVPRFDNQGVPFVYTVDEANITNYVSSISGYVITNTIQADLRTISGSKIWDDAGNETERPANITLNLLRDGIQYRQITLDDPTPDSTASFSFIDVPQFNSQGVEFVYTVEEPTITNYTPSIDGTNITNTYTP